MKVLVVGGGGREHALVWKLAQSKSVDKIYCTPGNAGIATIAECVSMDLSEGFDALVDFVKYNWIDMTVVGPEEPLTKGIVDIFEHEGLTIAGPSRTAAQLEGSKIFAKEFMKRHKIPTAEYQTFNTYHLAEDYIRLKGAPIVIKVDGLAAGKGVFVCKSIQEALDALKVIFKDKAFGSAGDRVVIEDCIDGEEASFMVFTDGKAIVPMVTSQDHKRVFDGDEGPNTGGMGAYSPAPVITTELAQQVMQKIMIPTIEGLRSEGIVYKGVLYAGLMIKDGKPYVLEFNCRFGDPETQPVLMRLESDLLEIFKAISEQRLSSIEVKWRPDPAVCVVIASGGYPGNYKKGKLITGLDEVAKMQDVYVFHAGTAFKKGQFVTNGGRVLAVTAIASDIKSACTKAYDAVSKIHFEGMHYRKDIAIRAIKRG